MPPCYHCIYILVLISYQVLTDSWFDINLLSDTSIYMIYFQILWPNDPTYAHNWPLPRHCPVIKYLLLIRYINRLSDICVELLSNTELFSDIDLNLNINVTRYLLTKIYHLMLVLSDIKLLPDIKPFQNIKQ